MSVENLSVEELLSRLGNVKKERNGQYRADCPAHESKSGNTLHIKRAEDGKPLVHCFAGCTYEDILRGTGLWKDNLSSGGFGNIRPPKKRPAPKQEPPKTYTTKQVYSRPIFEFTTPNGEVLYVQRHKGAYYRPIGNDKWEAGIEGVTRVPYNLPALLDGVRTGKTVYHLEGCKDCNTAADWLGVPATTSGGANSWRPAFCSYYVGADAVIIRDNDDEGREYAETVARDLLPVAKSVKVVTLPGLSPKGDLTDFKEGGAQKEEFYEAVSNTPPWNEEAEQAEQAEPIRFERIDLGEPIESGIEPPEMLVPDVLYAGSVHGIYSAGGTGKTFFSLWLVKQVIQQDMPVILLDQENSVRIMSERLRDLGVSAEEVRRNLHYIPSPRMPLSEGAPAEFEELLDEVKPALVVFDSWINFLAGAGLDENSSVDIAAWAEAYPQRARIRGIACLILDHIPKEGNTARGSGRKLDYVDAMFELTKSQHFDRETVGRIDLRLKKDREGWLPWGVAFAVGGKDGKLVFDRTTFDNSAVIPDVLLPSDRTTLDALKSFGATGVRDKEWREEAIKRGLSRTTYYRSRGTLLEQGLAEEVMGKYFHKSPAKAESHSVPPESHGTNGTTANGGKSHESHHPKGWDHGTNQAGTSDLWGEV